jgi:UDP-glucose 4-epimerase
VAEPARYYTNKTANSLALFDACAEASVGTVIFSSTAAVYGVTVAAPVGESAPTVPISPYGWSKPVTEQMLQDIAEARGFSAGILRYFNVAGAHARLRKGQLTQGATHLIKVAVEAAVGGRPAIDVFGDDYDTPDGTCVRDFIHVSDLADAHVLAFERLHAGDGHLLLNCGYGRGYSVRQVLEAVGALAGPVSVRRAPYRPGDAPSVLADARALRATLPWQPRYRELTDIVATALAWERAQQTSEKRVAEIA